MIFCRMMVNSFGHHLGTIDFHCIDNKTEEKKLERFGGVNDDRLIMFGCTVPLRWSALFSCMMSFTGLSFTQAGHFKVRRSLTLLNVLF